MADNDETKTCTRCDGRGKYADAQRDPLVHTTCEHCDGTGRVPADTPDEQPAQEPRQVPFGTRPD